MKLKLKSCFRNNKAGKLFRFELTALIVTIIMSVLFIPMNLWVAFAESIDWTKEEVIASESNDGKKTADVYNLPENDYEATDIAFEETNERSETSKSFMTLNGDTILQDYGVPVHYYDGEKYADIDNTFSEQTTKNGETRYVNKNNSFKVTLDGSKNNKLVSVGDGRTLIELNPAFVNKNYSTSDVYVFDGKNNLKYEKELLKEKKNNSKNNKKLIKEKAKAKYNDLSQGIDGLNFKAQSLKNSIEENLSKINSSAYYHNVYDNIDIQYILEGKTLKENIILKAKTDLSSFKFELNLTGLVPEIDINGAVNFYNESREILYSIPKGYMYDANGINSYDVNYEIEENSDGAYSIIVNADENWLNDSNRAYPITIDPTIINFENKPDKQKFFAGNVFDSYTNGQPSGIGIGNFFKCYTLKYNIGVNFTELYGYMYISKTADGKNPYEMEGKVITGAYLNANIATRVNTPYVNAELVNRVATKVDDVIPYLQTKSISSTSGTFYGDKIKFDITNYVASRVGDHSLRFKIPYENKENSISFSNLILTITYANTQGINNNDYNVTMDMGGSGTGILSLNTGTLNYAFNDIERNDAIMPISISHIYNENFKNKYGIGYNWKLNIQQQITYDQRGTVYNDATGRQYPIVPQSSYYGIDELGLKFFTENGVDMLVDSSGNSMIFKASNGNNVLKEIHRYPSTYYRPLNTHKMEIVYNSTNTQILNVKGGLTNSGANNTVNFAYANNLLKSINYNNSTDKMTEYIYNGDKLSEAYLYVPNVANTHTYFYYNGSKLNGIYNANVGQNLFFDYFPDSALGHQKNKVSAYSEYFNGAYANDKITYVNYTYPETLNGADEGVTNVTTLEKNGFIQHAAFAKNHVVSSYVYEKKNNKIVPNNAVSSGFNYNSFFSTYADRQDVFYDYFASLSGWSGGSLSSTYFVQDKSNTGKSLYKGATSTLTKTVNNIGGTKEQSYALSFWIKKSVNTSAKVEVTINDADNLKGTKFSYYINPQLTDWQFGTINLNNIIALRSITIKVISSDIMYLGEMRMVKLPFQAGTLQTDGMIETNDSGNVTKSYKYNPNTDTFSILTYSYAPNSSQ